MQAGEVLSHWGFAYASNLVWDKELQSMGYWSFVVLSSPWWWSR